MSCHKIYYLKSTTISLCFFFYISVYNNNLLFKYLIKIILKSCYFCITKQNFLLMFISILVIFFNNLIKHLCLYFKVQVKYFKPKNSI